MVALTDPARLVLAWEAAAAVPYPARGAVLLWQAGLVDDLDAALDLSVGRTAALAARAHVDLFGDQVESLLTCLACGQVLDVSFPVARLVDVTGADETVVVTGAGRSLVVRAPTTRDLLGVASTSDPAGSLRARCLRWAGGGRVDPAQLDEDTRDRVEAGAESLAGAAAIMVSAACPDCGAEVATPLDLGGLLWERVAAAAPAVLATVAELAAAFGWSEAEALALSPGRRRAYLSLIRRGRE